MKNTLKIFFFSFSLLFLFSACKKIDVPNEDARKIFGSWEYKSNSGGVSGSGGSNKYIVGQSLEFTDKGVLKVYEGSKKISKFRFIIEVQEGVFNGSVKNSIVYEKGGHDVFQVKNNQLILSDDYADGFTYIFTRK